MGFGSTVQNVLALLYALETELARHGFRAEKGAGVAAAARYLNADL
jgi:aspartate aminotransferase-like enzyme